MELIYKITDIVWMVVVAIGAVIYICERLRKRHGTK